MRHGEVMTRCSGCAVVDEAELADLHLVTGVQRRLVDQLPVHVRPVEGPGIAHHVTRGALDEHGVLARDRHVVEEDVGVGMPTGHDLGVVEQEPGP